ncbi:hypothetical protein FOCC_FOCC008192 [Frankliniella occidentalis]|nr:hypothetical protein FOCC_FOCC008192 [Frankliniella occidentalis]
MLFRNTRRGFPGVLGYVDGSLVGLASPHEPAKHIYRSRKGFYAINTLVVCDADLNILYFNAQFPGSAHDSWVYRRTPIRNAMREAYRDGPCWLLGNAYPHEPWLMKPILEAAPDSPEWRYTRLHCRGRSSVERCIGVLKGRWRCLLWERSLHYQPDKAGKIAQACVVLHNFLRARNVADPEPFAEDDSVDDHEVEELEDELAEANRNRNHLVQVAQQRHQQQHQ